MINNPPLEKLIEKIDGRFNVVIAVSKRARQLSEGCPQFYEGPEKNPLTIATKEIAEGSIQCETVDVFGESL